jgi:outer membrane lipoprotein-sorting protein
MGVIVVKRACMILVLIGLWPLGSVRADDQLSGILDGVRDLYGQLSGLSVVYEREVITKSMAMLGIQTKKDVASGRIYFKPPHFLRLEQETPRPETVINNGDILWWYIPRKKQVYRYPSQKLGREMRILYDIFQGLRKVKDSFEVTLVAYGSKDGHELRLTPKPPWEQIEHIKLWVDPEDFHIRMVESHDYLGGLTRFTLGSPAAKKTFEKNYFNFPVPEGVKVIEEE